MLPGMCNVRNKQTHGDRKWLPGAAVWGVRVTANGHEVSFWGDEDVLEILVMFAQHFEGT